MQNLPYAEVLRAAAEFVIVLDQHRVGAAIFGIFLAMTLAAALVRPKQAKQLKRSKLPRHN